MISSFRSSLFLLAMAGALLPGCRAGTTTVLAENAAAHEADDSLVSAAAGALAQGRPWHASRLLAPVLQDPARRTSEAVLLAATAAERWGGWSEVRRLLEREPWRDTVADGRANALLARAALAQGRDSSALSYALSALERADADLTRGERLVLAARALDRMDRRDSAAVLYRKGAGLLPDAADWLYLRAAAVSDDSLARRQDFARLTGRIAPARVGWVEEAGRERAGDLIGAARLADSLGAPATALRLRLGLAADGAARDSIRAQLVALVRKQSGSSTARLAVAVLDSALAPLAPATELVVARSLAQSGPLARAADGYERAFKAGLGGVDDRMAYAGLLIRLGRPAQAAHEYSRVSERSSRGGEAAYGRARALVRAGRVTAGREALVKLGNRFPRDTDWAATALYLRADLATDDGDDAEARALFLMAAHRYPTSRVAANARFRAAVVALAGGQDSAAAVEFDSLAVLYPRSDDALAARYWSGRAWYRVGDTTAATARWAEVTRREPTSYYAVLSARRLGRSPWLPDPAEDVFQVYPGLDSAMARAALLERLGLEREAGWEYDQITRDADQSIERMLATADALRSHGRASQAIRLAYRALSRGAAPDSRVYRLIYPATQADALMADAVDQGLEPAFVAALIRQESMFNPGALSAAGARGLMQLMPAVGRQLARGQAFPVWDPVLLYQPDVNLRLGTLHLKELAGRYPEPVQVLAAYNAGASRVDRWLDKPGVDDPELFAERIPYTETRDYVRIIQRNRELYRALYDWSDGTVAAAPAPNGAAGGGR